MNCIKWERAGLPQEWYQNELQTGSRIVDLKLHHPMRAWNILRWNPAFRYLEVLVENQWREAAPFIGGLGIEWNDWFTKNSPSEKWCCTQEGFVNRKSNAWETLPSCASLSYEQLQKIQTASQSLRSPLAEGETTPCVLEIVNTMSPAQPNCLTDGVLEYLRRAHLGLRLIDEQGKVYSVGFNASIPLEWKNILFAQPGEFRAPDTLEGLPATEKLVTPIAITRAQFDQAKEVVETYRREGKSFHYLKHNCTAFATDILHRLGFSLNTKVSYRQILWHALPKMIQAILTPLGVLIDKICQVARWIFSPIGRLLSKKKTDPRLFQVKQAGPFNVFLPYKLRKWQRRQPTTKLISQGATFQQTLAL